jgi:NitT/TauT family transport system permease protein
MTIGVSILTGWILGYFAIKNKIFENLYTSLIGIFESIPVVSFFPIVLLFFINNIGGLIGIELAADFLVFTAVVWNIWVAIYQSYKTIPISYIEVAENFRFKLIDKFLKIYIPFSVPRIAAQLLPSFSSGLFYITVSEIFSIGTTSYSVFGIGELIEMYTSNFDVNLMLILISILITFIVIITELLRRFTRFAIEKYGLDTEMKVIKKGRIRTRYSIRIYNTLSPVVKISKLIVNRVRVLTNSEQNFMIRRKIFITNKIKLLIIKTIVIILFLISILNIILFLLNIPLREWLFLISLTPSILYSILIDYIRVGIILGVSLTISLLIPYYISVHAKLEKIVINFLQIFSSLPPVTYFPLLFAISHDLVLKVFNGYSNEFYVILLGFLSTFSYIFYSSWLGIKNIPYEVWEVTKNLRLDLINKIRYIIFPSSLPYLVTGLSSTINGAWGGLTIGEYWPNIYDDYTLEVKTGIMKNIAIATSNGNIDVAAWNSLIFGIIIAIYSIFIIRKFLDRIKDKYIVEESVYIA